LGWWEATSCNWAVRQQAAGTRPAALAGWGWRLWGPVAIDQHFSHISRNLRDREVARKALCALRNPAESAQTVSMATWGPGDTVAPGSQEHGVHPQQSQEGKLRPKSKPKSEGGRAQAEGLT
jgi:hypothetical protein